MGGIGAGFLLYVLAKVTGDLSKAGLMGPMAAAALPPAVGGVTGLDCAAVPGGRLMARPPPMLDCGVAAPGAARLMAFLRPSHAGCRPAWLVAVARPDAGLSAASETAGQTAPAPVRSRCSCAPQEINYDYTNERVSAVGNVQLYFGASTLEADRVIYDQKTKRLHAEGKCHADAAATAPSPMARSWI